MGPGTELKRLLNRFGIKSTKQCNCDQKALVMDEEGPEWCLANKSTIVKWLREEAEQRKLPFNNFVGTLLVLRAVKNYRKKERLLER